jgi:hypothetical protein
MSLSPFRALILAVAVILTLSLGACGGPPSWVKKGSAEFYQKDPNTLYGVGAVMGVRNEPLAWEVAENRARAELARNIQTYTAYLMRDYAASTTAGDLTRTSDEQNVERATKTFTAMTLSGVRSIDRYKDPETGTYYVAVKLDLEKLKNFLSQSQELDSRTRDFVRKNAERLFEKLEKEEAKRAAAQ